MIVKLCGHELRVVLRCWFSWPCLDDGKGGGGVSNICFSNLRHVSGDRTGQGSCGSPWSANIFKYNLPCLSGLKHTFCPSLDKSNDTVCLAQPNRKSSGKQSSLGCCLR